jgi:hypothetical protein
MSLNSINREPNQCHVLTLRSQLTFILLCGTFRTVYPCDVGHKPRILLLTTDLRIMNRYSFNSLLEKQKCRTYSKTATESTKRTIKRVEGLKVPVDIRVTRFYVCATNRNNTSYHVRSCWTVQHVRAQRKLGHAASEALCRLTYLSAAT